MKRKRYLLFEIDQYCPGGGLDDAKFTCDSLEEAAKYMRSESYHADFTSLWDRIDDVEYSFTDGKWTV